MENLSVLDIVIRLLLSFVLSVVCFFDYISGWMGIGMIIISVGLAITAAYSFCPIYKFFGIRTKKSPKVK